MSQLDQRQYSLLDKLLTTFDQAVRTLCAETPMTREDKSLTQEQRQTSVGLMRVNHSGEVCAQALYQGQALTAKNKEVQQALEKSAREEIDHLAWCAQRISELGGRQSILNPLWYLGSLGMGAAVGLFGDRLSLGFLAETERQVSAHLENHLQRLPAVDEKSRAIVEKMRVDEMHHADVAIQAGARELPAVAKMAMRLLSKVMTKTAYYF